MHSKCLLQRGQVLQLVCCVIQHDLAAICKFHITLQLCVPSILQEAVLAPFQSADGSKHLPPSMDRLCPIGTAARVLQLSRLVQVRCTCALEGGVECGLPSCVWVVVAVGGCMCSEGGGGMSGRGGGGEWGGINQTAPATAALCAKQAPHQGCSCLSLCMWWQCRP
jgi:hypothetical protein